MEHFCQNIQGWFTYHSLYKYIVENSLDGAHFVEVGSWLGCSSTFFAVEILNSNKKLRLDCVDTWKGSEEHKDMDIIKNDDLYNHAIHSGHLLYTRDAQPDEDTDRAGTYDKRRNAPLHRRRLRYRTHCARPGPRYNYDNNRSDSHRDNSRHSRERI